jgi:uncharacterized protein (TIGR02117 family)
MRSQTPPHAMTRRLLLRGCLAAGTAQALIGCSSATAPAHREEPREGITVFLLAGGWHTEIAVPVHAVHGPLSSVARDAPGAQFLAFGWGERNYYMARAPTIGDAMRALLPGPAVLLVTPLHGEPRNSRPAAQIFQIGLTTAGFDRLSSYLWAAFETSGDGKPRRLAAGPDPGSVFYAATGTYSATYTCNTWTVEGLRAGGIPVNPAGVVLADHVTDQLRSLGVRASTGQSRSPSG